MLKQNLKEKQTFVELMKSQFSVETQPLINTDTDFKSLKEWTSLQTMIVVSEIDQQYNVILVSEDFTKAQTFEDLFHVVMSRIN